MNMGLRGTEAIYGALLRLFPGEFQTEFREEMQDVFHSMATEAARSGGLPLLRVCFYEILDLPINLVEEHISHLRKERSMKKLPLGTRSFRSAQLGGVGLMIGMALLLLGQRCLTYPDWWYNTRQIITFEILLGTGLWTLANAMCGLFLCIGNPSRRFNLRIILGMAGGGAIGGFIRTAIINLLYYSGNRASWIHIASQILGWTIVGLCAGIGLGIASKDRKAYLRFAIIGMLAYGLSLALMEVIDHLIPLGFYFTTQYPVTLAWVIGYYLLGCLSGLLAGGGLGWFWGKERADQTEHALAGAIN